MRIEDEVTIYIGVKNGGNSKLDLLLEPWAEDFSMPPGAKYVIEGLGPREGAGFWVEHSGNEILVHAWPGSVVRVLENGREVGGPVKRPPAPDLSD
jgi:hypothetical protein